MNPPDGRRAAPRFRSQIFALHRWLGLQFAFFFIFMFVTGTILLVTDELEAVFHPNIWSAKADETTAASFGDIYDSVAKEFPQSRIFILQRQPRPWLADRSNITTSWGEKIIVWTDPKTAEVVDVTQTRNFRFVLHDLHDSLLIPGRVAFVVVTATSLILLAILIAGLITYRRFWRGLFRWPDQSTTWRSRQGGLHRLFAVWCVVFLLITSITGTFFMLTGLGLKGSIPRFQTAVERPRSLPQNFEGALIDRAQKLAVDASGIQPKSVVLPANSKKGIQFSGFTEDVGILSGATKVSIDPVNFNILGQIRPDQFRGIARITPLMNALHFGEWAGPYSRALWFGFGTLACYLIIAGLRVAVSRQDNSEKAATTGLFRSVVRRMRIFKWAYVLTIIGVLAVAFLRYGPASSQWITLPVSGASSGYAKVQIRGPLRHGKAANLRVIVGQMPVSSLRILDSNNSELLIVGPATANAKFEFKLFGNANANNFSSILQFENGPDQVGKYVLGKAFW